VPHYWLVDPREEMLTVHGQELCAEPFEAVELQVGVLFGDDPDET
jgi:hypothetical protein